MFEDVSFVTIGISILISCLLAPALLIALFFPLSVLAVPVLATGAATVLLGAGRE